MPPARAEAKAPFFVIGRKVSAHPELARAAFSRSMRSS